MNNLRVSTGDFIKNFGRLSDQALTDPVTITKNGRDRLVVLSVDEYHRLRRRDRQAIKVEDMPDDLAAALAVAEPAPEAEAFAHEYRRGS